MRRDPGIGERRLVGRIKAVADGQVHLSESADGIDTIPVTDVHLEGSRTAFAHCLSTLLGHRYTEFKDALREHEAAFLTGPALEGLLERMGDFLQKAPIRLTSTLTCTVGDLLSVANMPDYQSVVRLQPDGYCFDAARTKRSRYAWSGSDHLADAPNYNAAIVVLPDEYANLAGADSVYLIAKATLLMNAIPTQEVRVSTLTDEAKKLQTTFRNLAVALYAKMGGVPWTVNQDETVDDELVVGMGTAELSGSRFEPRQRFVGVTTVFRGDGNFLLSHLSAECSYENYPAVLEQTLVRVLESPSTTRNSSRSFWRNPAQCQVGRLKF